MSAARIFPLAAPLFDVGTVTITKKAKALLERQCLTVDELLDRFRRCDWPEDGWLFGQNMEALREGREIEVTWTFDAPLTASEKQINVECIAGKFTKIETGWEYCHRPDPPKRRATAAEIARAAEGAGA